MNVDYKQTLDVYLELNDKDINVIIYKNEQDEPTVASFDLVKLVEEYYDSFVVPNSQIIPLDLFTSDSVDKIHEVINALDNASKRLKDLLNSSEILDRGSWISSGSHYDSSDSYTVPYTEYKKHGFSSLKENKSTLDEPSEYRVNLKYNHETATPRSPESLAESAELAYNYARDLLRSGFNQSAESDDDPPEQKNNFYQEVKQISYEITNMLVEKNKAYGDSALNPLRVFSKADTLEQIKVRIDDKLSRIYRGRDFLDEDVVLDLIGYLFMYKIQTNRNLTQK